MQKKSRRAGRSAAYSLLHKIEICRPLEPFPMIDGIDDGALGDEIVDRLRIDPIADGEQQKDEKERFGKPQ